MSGFSRTPPRAVLLDYGGTLVEERSVDLRAANEWMLARASHVPDGVSLDAVMTRVRTIYPAVVARRQQFEVEIPFRSIARLIFDPLGVTFDTPWEDLEMGFWRASVSTGPLPGVADALAAMHARGVRLAALSNTSYSSRVIRSELERHGLARHLEFVMVSSEYGLRKPQPLLFEAAARCLGLPPAEIWMVGDRLDADVRGANAVGMTSVWLRGPGVDLAADAADQPHMVLDGWAALSLPAEA